jgi:hypothetical protein
MRRNSSRSVHTWNGIIRLWLTNTIKASKTILSGMIKIAVKINNRIYERKMKRYSSYAKPFGDYSKKKKTWNKRRDLDAMDIDNVNLKPKQDWKKKP